MSESTNFYRCTPRQVRSMVIDILEAGLVPFVKSSPGIGKSSIMRSVAEELNLRLIDHRLSTSDPTDLSGLPQFVDGKARFAPFSDLFPIQGTPLPKGRDGWAIFFDEFNSAKKDVQAACYKTILDRAVGQYPLHDNVVMMAAGNLETDRAIVNAIGTAMQSRVITLQMEVHFPDWRQDVALAQNYDNRIVAFHEMNKGAKLMDFRPDHQEHTFCCPRTWEFMNRLVQGREVTEDKTPMYAGTITSGVAAEFVQFCQVYKNLITVKQILANPETCPVPHETPMKWATVSNMMGHVDDETFEKLATYANRLGLDFRVLFFRSVMVRHKHLRHHDAFRGAMVELSRYLNG